MDRNNVLKDNTCVIFDETNSLLFQSTEKGVKPLLDFFREHGIKSKLTVYDKIMGRGAVLLAKLIGAETIDTPLISEDALSLAREYGMKIIYDEVVPYIVNRDNTGRCPIETSVIGISDVQIGLQAILGALNKLKS